MAKSDSVPSDVPRVRAQRRPARDGIDSIEVLNAGMLRGSLPRNWWTKWQRVGEDFDPDAS